MKRLLIVPILVLAMVAPASAQADADDLYPTENTPIIFQCKGTGGNEQTVGWGEVWRARHEVYHLPDGSASRSCMAWAPDDADPITIPPPLGGHALRVVPVGYWGSMDLKGVGGFACGEGTLTSPGSASSGINYQRWTNPKGWGLDWQAEFHNGVGEVTGTAHRPNEVRDVSGTIVVEDGAATGNCDDSTGAADVIVTLVLTPQDEA